MAKKKTSAKQYWLLKTEPTSFSIDDLVAAPGQTTFWDGIRNYQARNMLRDEIKSGHEVFIYHSNADPMAIVGTAVVVQDGYPDHTAFDPQSKYYDEKSSPDDPTWFMVDIQLLQKFPEPVTRESLKAEPKLADMPLLQRGSRLSVQPVSPEHWKIIHQLAGVKPV